MFVENANYDAHSEGPSGDSLIWNGSYSLLLKKKSIPVTVNLTATSFHLNRKKSLESFKFDEIATFRWCPYEVHFGKSSKPCKRGHQEKRGLESDVCLQLVLYPSRTNSRHRRRIITMLINTHSDYDDNLNEAKLFQSKLSSLIHIGNDGNASMRK